MKSSTLPIRKQHGDNMKIDTGWTLAQAYCLTLAGFVFFFILSGLPGQNTVAQNTASYKAWSIMGGVIPGIVLFIHDLFRRRALVWMPIGRCDKPIMSKATGAASPADANKPPRPSSRGSHSRKTTPQKRNYKVIIAAVIACITIAGGLVAGRNYATHALLDAAALNQSGDMERAERMIQFGADVNARQDGATPLIIITRKLASNQNDAPLLLDDAVRLADRLIARGAKVNIAGERGNTPLHYAFDAKMAELLLARGADVNARNEKGETPLHAVAYLNHPAPPGIHSPSRREASARQAEAARVLIEHGADINAVYQDGVTPLQAAVITGNVDVAKQLIVAGAGVNPQEQPAGMKNPLLHRAIQSPDMVKLLLAAGADVRARGSNDYTPLHEACSQTGGDNVKTVITLLIAAGANVNAASSSDGNTPLHKAAYSGNIEAVRLLLESGANVNAINAEGKSPLAMARYSSGKAEERIVIFDLLKQKGAYETSAAFNPNAIPETAKHE